MPNSCSELPTPIRQTLRALVAIGLFWSWSSTLTWGANWPQFRGPTGQGLADAAPVPTVWNERKNIAWKTPLEGRGHSSPVVWGTQVWLTTASTDGKRLGAIGLDRMTGEVIHTVAVFAPTSLEEIHADNTFASPTPVITEGRLYVDFGTYGVACIDTDSGQVLWRNQSLRCEHQGGPGSSPVLFEETLIVHRDGADQQFVAALDIKNGRIRWRRDRSAPFRENPITHRAFASPLLYEHQGRTLLISPAADQCHAYDAATGEELWHVRYIGFSNVPCPVAVGDHVYICTGFFSPELRSVRLGGSGDVTESHVEWAYKAQIPDVSSPILVDGRIYFVSTKGVLSCVDAATGDRIYIHRLGGNFSASPLFAGGLLYFCNKEGVTKVVRPGEDHEIISSNKLDDGIHASPIAVDGALYIRTETHLYRIEEEQP
ncbi:MAG: PQQ-binding-like beta-propeller repeat protein [Planctomycetaceae bacterium]|nr:PQQ-binding-like beta-propeller repeat protein [Planctomycetaceae bacterium]